MINTNNWKVFVDFKRITFPFTANQYINIRIFLNVSLRLNKSIQAVMSNYLNINFRHHFTGLPIYSLSAYLASQTHFLISFIRKYGFC